MRFGERLKKARIDAGLSQKQLEAASGVSQKTISKIERGDQEGSTQVAALARACGVNTDWLASEHGPMNGAGTSLAKQERAEYAALSPDSLEIARAFEQLQPQAREYIREQVFIYTVIDKSFPWLRHGRPMGKTYDEFEKWHQRNIAVKDDLARQRAAKRKKTTT